MESALNSPEARERIQREAARRIAEEAEAQAIRRALRATANPLDEPLLPLREVPGGEQVMDLRDEELETYDVRTEPLPPREQTRRELMIGLAVAFVALLLLQIGFAVIGGDLWERVGPVLSTAATLVAAGFGYVWGHYFTGRP